MKKQLSGHKAVLVRAGSQTHSQMLSEASLQEQAIKRLSVWELNCVTFMAFGIILGFCGFVNKILPVSVGIVGVSAAVFFFAVACMIHISIRNGRRNVAEIRNLAEKQKERKK